MTDRELLELAAKAAGIRVRCIGDGCRGGNVVFYMEPEQLYWDPLADDGDALRLAVALGLVVETGHAWISKHGPVFGEDVLPCPYAATRRATVRAAASIGKAMP